MLSRDFNEDFESEDFYKELKTWREEIVNDLDIITEGLRIQGDEGKIELIRLYRGLSYKILKWKEFVRESNKSRKSKD